MDVGGVAGFLGRTGDFEDAVVEVGLSDLRDAVGRGAFPAVADAFESVARYFAFEGVMEQQGALRLKPGRVVRGGEGECEEAEE